MSLRTVAPKATAAAISPPQHENILAHQLTLDKF